MEVVMSTAMGVVFLTITLAFVWVAKLASDMFAEFSPDDEIKNGNLAVALRRGGFYLGIAVGMFGAVSGPSQGFVVDVANLIVDGLIITVLLFVARAINDFIVLGNVSNAKAIRNGNMAVGFVEFGGYLATGIVAMAAFAGEGSLLSAVIFFVAGQVVFLAVAHLYDIFASGEILEEIEFGNTSAGLVVGGLMVATSVALFGAIAGDGGNLLPDLFSFAVYATVAVVALMVVSVVADHLLLPSVKAEAEIQERNVAVSVVLVAVNIGVALMINAAIV